jgi:uncharacterized protein Usg
MASRAFLRQLDGYGLTTAEIHYRLPDHPSWLQLYVWQEYDLAPDFPGLRAFLRYWQQQMDGALSLLRAGHQRLIHKTELRVVKGMIIMH